MGVYFFGCTGPQTLGEALSFRAMGNWGGKMFWCMENGGGDVMRKYTFECGARPAGTASCFINLTLIFADGFFFSESSSDPYRGD